MLKQSVDTRDCSFLCKHSLGVDIHVIKPSLHCERVGGTAFFSQRELSLFAKNREMIMSNPLLVEGLR